MKTIQKQVKFSKGEVNEKLLERTDIDTLNASAAYIKNMVSTPYGSLRTRGGTKKIAKLSVTEARLEGFVFNLDQKYVLVLEEEKILVYQNDALLSFVNQLEGNRQSYAPASGLYTDYFPNLKVTQAEDTMIFTHPNMVTKQLKRVLRSGTISSIGAAGTNVTLTISDYSIVRVGSPVYIETSAGAEYATVTEWVAFDHIKVDKLTLTHTTSNTRITATEPDWVFESFPWEYVPYDLFGYTTVTYPAYTLTPSAVEGSVKLTASGGTVFSASSVGQLIDGGGGRVRITKYESATVVWGYTIIPFYSTAAIASETWQYITGYEQVWSATKGYPSTCLFYEQNLCFGGSKYKPNTFWKSRVGQVTSFENVANYANDAISATIASEQIDEIVNMYANRGIQIFTSGAEWNIEDGTLTPDDIQVKKNTSNGSLGTVRPVDIAGTTMFIERNGKSLLSYVYNNVQDALTTSSLSLLTDMIDAPVAMAVDYNSSKDVGNFLYIVNGDGTMPTACILLDQQINSFVRFETDGEIKSVVSAGDTYILVERDTGLFLEKLDEYQSDCTIETTTSSTTVSGLSDLEGQDVYAYSDTELYGTFTVSSGAITLPSIPTGTVYVGLPFTYQIISNKVAINGQTNNIEKRISKATVVTKDTPKLTFCGQTKEQDDDEYDYYGCTSWARDCRFTITGSWDEAEVLSILLNINYGVK